MKKITTILLSLVMLVSVAFGSSIIANAFTYGYVDLYAGEITNVKVSNVTTKGYTVTCDVSSGYGARFTTYLVGDDSVVDTQDIQKDGTTCRYVFSKANISGEYKTVIRKIESKNVGGFDAISLGQVNTENVKVSVTVAKPTITVNNVAGGKKITLKSSTTGASIYYKTSKSASYKKYTGAFTLTSTKTVYAYAKKSGCLTSSTASKKVTVNTTPKPTGLKVSSTTSSAVKLKWSKVSGASGYYIYRATSKSGTYSKVGSVTSGSTVSYTSSGLSSSKTYYFKIKAYTLGKNTSAYSAIVSGKTKKPAWESPAVELIYNFPKYGFENVDVTSSIEIVDLNNDSKPEIIYGDIWRANSLVGGIYYFNGTKYVKASFAKSSIGQTAMYPIYPVKDTSGKKYNMSYNLPTVSEAEDSLDMIYDGHASYYLAYRSYVDSYTFASNKLTYKMVLDLTDYIYDVQDGYWSSSYSYINELSAFRSNYSINKDAKYLVTDFYCGSLFQANTASQKLTAYHKIVTKTKAENMVKKYQNKTHSYSLN